MSLEIEIAGQTAQVRIEVFGYENPTAQESSDANWLTCRVEVRVRSFSGQVDAAFTTQDFAAFGRCLRSAVAEVKGAAAFETDENALQLNVEFTRTGAVRVSGTLREADRPQTSLTFSFESDQTFISRTADALDELTRRFPIRA
jgi:hypothetical protein